MCVELKSDIKRDFEFELTVNDIDAEGLINNIHDTYTINSTIL